MLGMLHRESSANEQVEGSQNKRAHVKWAWFETDLMETSEALEPVLLMEQLQL